VRSGQEAETLYRELAEGNPDGRYADEARLELAKIQFATGRYEGAYGTLHDANACDHSEEACLFEGMSAVMLHRYNDAIPVLQNIRKGQAKVWATLSLAEAMDGAGQHDDACDRYEALARARVSPAAWYRYAECLEKRGDRDGARREYQALGSAFPQTPEAIRAAEKLNATAPATPPPAPEMAAPEAAPRSSGYTLQFGSFADRDNAMKLAADIKQTYPAVRIDSELINYKEVFRVRIGFYPTRDAARRAGEEMAKLINQPYTIMPVPSKP
ncbi:MAG TPA: SPOR domain-containing protein, partial [Candidatus Krumholzibacteria bacterium]|nr:SPOR domain-containing protein [Candidatus Krumholzibacteria bacterium]